MSRLLKVRRYALLEETEKTNRVDWTTVPSVVRGKRTQGRGVSGEKSPGYDRGRGDEVNPTPSGTGSVGSAEVDV